MTACRSWSAGFLGATAPRKRTQDAATWSERRWGSDVGRHARATVVSAGIGTGNRTANQRDESNPVPPTGQHGNEDRWSFRSARSPASASASPGGREQRISGMDRSRRRDQGRLVPSSCDHFDFWHLHRSPRRLLTQREDGLDNAHQFLGFWSQVCDVPLAAVELHEVV